MKANGNLTLNTRDKNEENQALKLWAKKLLKSKYISEVVQANSTPWRNSFFPSILISSYIHHVHLLLYMQFEFQMFYCSFLTIFSSFYLLLYLISYMKDVAIMFIKLTYFLATLVTRSESIYPSPNHVQFHGLTEIYSLHIQSSTCYWLQSKKKTRLCAMRSTFEDINYRLFLPAIFVMWQTEVAQNTWRQSHESLRYTGNGVTIWRGCRRWESTFGWLLLFYRQAVLETSTSLV